MSACPKQQSVANCLGPRNGAAESAKDAAATMPPLQLEPVFSARCGPEALGGITAFWESWCNISSIEIMLHGNSDRHPFTYGDS